MILDTTDIELLRLLGWCKNIPADIYKSLGIWALHPQVISRMEQLGFINVTDNGLSIRLRPRGGRLLRYLGFDFHEDAGYRSDYGRRLEVANILLTFYRAGYDVFARSLEDLAVPQVFLQAPEARRNSSAGDLWGGASFHGMACMQEHVSACYYISGHEEPLLHRKNERLLLDKAAAILRRGNALLFAGSDYPDMVRLLRNKAQSGKTGNSRKKTYAEMYKDTICPLCLLECSDAGALQLLIMAQDQYRKRIGRTFFDAEPVPPVGVRDADGLVVLEDEPYPTPWVLGVDMDIKRIGRALKQTMDSGDAKLMILCLESQKKIIEYLYEETGRVMVVDMKPEAITAALGELRLHDLKRDAYYTREGGVLDIENLPLNREAGKQVRGKAGKA